MAAGVDPKRTELRFLFGTLVVFALLAFLVFRPFLSYVALGVLLVFAFWPVHAKLRKRFRNRGLAAMISFVLVSVILLAPIVLVGVLVFRDAVDFAATYDPNHLNETVEPILVRLGVVQPGQTGEEGAPRTSAAANWLGDRIQAGAAALGGALLQALPGLLLGLFLTGFIIYYGFLDGEKFYRQLRYALPLPDKVEDELFHQLRDVTRAVFLSTMFVALLTAGLASATFLVFGVPNAVFWGFITFIFGLLPVLGAPMIYVPAGIYVAVEGHVYGAIGLLAINAILGTLYVERVIGPRIVGRLGRIHPVWVLIGVLGGIGVFGVLGFVLGPLVLAIFIALVRSYTQIHPRWKGRVAKEG